MAAQPNDIFSGDGSNPASAGNGSDDTYASYLDNIKNEEGKRKYDSIPKALEGLVNAQQYIPKLKAEKEALELELNKLKEEAGKAASVEEVIKRLQANQATPPASNQGTPPVTQPEGLNEEAIAKLVQGVLEKERAQTSAQSNLGQVTNKLIEKFGDKANDVIKQKASEVGMSVESIKSLASQSPQAALAIFGLQAGTKGSNPTTGGISMPLTTAPTTDVPTPQKSMLLGASNKDVIAYMREIRKAIDAKHGITS